MGFRNSDCREVNGVDSKKLGSWNWFEPMLDVAANDREYTISVELPGVCEKDAQLEFSHDTLVIKGEKKQEKEEKDKNFYRMERSYGSLQRVLSMPEDAEQEGIAAADINQDAVDAPFGFRRFLQTRYRAFFK